MMLAQFIIIDAALHDHHEGRRNRFLFKSFQRFAANPGEVRTAQCLECFGPQRIELQIDLEARLEGRQGLHEIRLLGDPHAVGVEHHMADRPALGRGDDLENLRMDRRLAAGELQQIGLAFAGDQRIHHPLDFGQWPVHVSLRRAIGKAHRTGQVAGLVDIDERQAGMLLMIRT